MTLVPDSSGPMVPACARLRSRPTERVRGHRISGAELTSLNGVFAGPLRLVHEFVGAADQLVD